MSSRRRPTSSVLVQVIHTETKTHYNETIVTNTKEPSTLARGDEHHMLADGMTFEALCRAFSRDDVATGPRHVAKRPTTVQQRGGKARG